jgi:hypothetical protein
MRNDLAVSAHFTIDGLRLSGYLPASACAACVARAPFLFVAGRYVCGD